MAWVLWDILIPLMASFALGTLLGWLLWSWRRKSQYVGRASGEAASAASMAADSELSDTGVLTPQLNALRDESDLREIENANITLISERDQANQAFEKLQLEADDMREKIAELEAQAEQYNGPESAADSLEIGNDTEKSSIASPSVEIESKDSKELELLRSDTQQLTRTLERERKARRATELELLNIKNRHDKLASEITSTVSVDDHETALKDRDEVIESLKDQLAAKAEQKESKIKIEEVAVEAAPQPKAETKAETEPEQANDAAVEPVEDTPKDTQINVALAAGIESNEKDDDTQSEKSADPQQKPIKNGHIPKGWTVPQNTPRKKERDKLTDIKGIGPVIEKMLHQCGIYYYHQVANLDVSGMEELQLQIPQFPGRIKRDKWVDQAKKLQQKKYGETA